LHTPATSGPQNVAGIILAAGESSRMGRDKALLPLTSQGSGQTFLEHLTEILDGEVSPLVIVLGHHADEIQKHIQLPPAARILRNPDYGMGQLSSLRVALQGLRGQDVAGALVCLVDHPALTKQVVRALLARFRQSTASILVPTFQGRRGHPVLFASRLFGELQDAPLDQGARWVVHRHPAEVELVEVDEEGILWDVDRPEDYDALKSRWASLILKPPGPSGARS
jgi:molybdenum cofactor cytidylyltransferase